MSSKLVVNFYHIPMSQYEFCSNSSNKLLLHISHFDSNITTILENFCHKYHKFELSYTFCSKYLKTFDTNLTILKPIKFQETQENGSTIFFQCIQFTSSSSYFYDLHMRAIHFLLPMSSHRQVYYSLKSLPNPLMALAPLQ